MFASAGRTGAKVADKKTAIVTGGSRGIGAAIVREFLDRGYNVVATAGRISEAGMEASANLAMVDGDIGEATTAEKVARTAIERFGSIDHVVNNAGIFLAKPFMDYSVADFQRLVSINLEGFMFMTQSAVRQMLAQGSGGSVTTISAALADNPIAGEPASIAMMTKGGLNAVTLSLASEFAKDKIRFNAVAPGIVETSLQNDEGADYLHSRNPMGMIATPKAIAEAVLYLAEAVHVTGEVLRVDDGAHVGQW